MIIMDFLPEKLYGENVSGIFSDYVKGDGQVINLDFPFFVIPANAGIQSL